MEDDLTVENFIAKIKAMTKRQRTSIPAEKLIDLILEFDDAANNVDPRFKTLEALVQQLQGSVQHITTLATGNQTEIAKLKTANTGLRRSLEEAKNESEELRTEIQELTRNTAQNDEKKALQEEIRELKSQVNEIEQYLRVNNIEIVGLPPPDADDGETEEDVIVKACNSLAGIDQPVRPEDIDISHPLKSDRRDGKPVHIVRFISRKVKYAILAAKKDDRNRQFKFRDKDVYMNEHLSRPNRALFATANGKKRELNYKFLWTKNGVVHMRKDENSNIITIKNAEDFQKVV